MTNSFERDAQDGLTPIQIIGAKNKAQHARWYVIARQLFTAWAQSYPDIATVGGRREWRLPGGFVEAMAVGGSFRVRVTVTEEETEEEETEGSECELFLESGLIGYNEASDYFPLDSLRRDPATLWEGDGVASLRGLEPPLVDFIEFDDTEIASRIRPPGTKDSLSWYGISAGEYAAIDADDLPEVDTRLEARKSQNLMADWPSTLTGKCQWWIRSRLSQLSPALVPEATLFPSVPGLRLFAVEGELIDFSDGLLTHRTGGTWGAILVKPSITATGNTLRWRPATTSECGALLMAATGSEDATFSALEAETLEMYALAETVLDPDDEWQTVAIDGIEGGAWAYGWKWGWGSGATHDAYITTQRPVTGDGTILSYDLWYYRLRVTIGEDEDGALVVSAAVTLIDSGNASFPINAGNVYTPDFEAPTTMVRKNPMKVAAFEPSQPIQGGGPVYVLWTRTGPGDAGSPELIRWDGAVVASFDGGFPIDYICGLGAETFEKIQHNGGDEHGFSCNRESQEVIDSSSYTQRRNEVFVEPFDLTTPISVDTGAKGPSGSIGAGAIACNPSDLTAINAAVIALPSDASWRTQKYSYGATRHMTGRTIARTSRNTGTWLMVPWFDANSVYMGRTELADGSDTHTSYERAEVYRIEAEIYDGLISNPLSQVRYTWGVTYSLRANGSVVDTGNNSGIYSSYRVVWLGMSDKIVVAAREVIDNVTLTEGEAANDGWQRVGISPLDTNLQRSFDVLQSSQGYAIYSADAFGTEREHTGNYAPPGGNLIFSTWIGNS